MMFGSRYRLGHASLVSEIGMTHFATSWFPGFRQWQTPLLINHITINIEGELPTIHNNSNMASDQLTMRSSEVSPRWKRNEAASDHQRSLEDAIANQIIDKLHNVQAPRWKSKYELWHLTTGTKPWENPYPLSPTPTPPSFDIPALSRSSTLNSDSHDSQTSSDTIERYLRRCTRSSTFESRTKSHPTAKPRGVTKAHPPLSASTRLTRSKCRGKCLKESCWQSLEIRNSR